MSKSTNGILKAHEHNICNGSIKNKLDKAEERQTKRMNLEIRSLKSIKAETLKCKKKGMKESEKCLVKEYDHYGIPRRTQLKKGDRKH